MQMLLEINFGRYINRFRKESTNEKVYEIVTVSFKSFYFNKNHKLNLINFMNILFYYTRKRLLF